MNHVRICIHILYFYPYKHTQGKLAVQLERQLTHPHQFELFELKPNQYKECAFCKYQIYPENHAYKCKVCGNICHDDCKANMPYNCGQKHFLLRRRGSKKVQSACDQCTSTCMQCTVQHEILLPRIKLPKIVILVGSFWWCSTGSLNLDVRVGNIGGF